MAGISSSSPAPVQERRKLSRVASCTCSHPARAEVLAPRNIIAFTFTDKAAAELKERIVTRTRQALGDIPGMAEHVVGTIHAFCLELLKSESPKHLKVHGSDEVQQGLSSIATAARVASPRPQTSPAGVERYRDNRALRTRYQSCVSGTRRCPAHGCSLLNGLTAYQGLLEDQDYLDYSSILEEAVTPPDQRRWRASAAR